MKKNNIPINREWILHGDFSEDYGYDSFMSLYNKKNLPELILAVSYPVAIGIYKAVHDLNLKIPEDIDLICFGDAPEQQFFLPPLSCIRQPIDLIVDNAFEILFESINNIEFNQSKCIEVKTELILRGTCIGK